MGGGAGDEEPGFIVRLGLRWLVVIVKGEEMR